MILFRDVYVSFLIVFWLESVLWLYPVWQEESRLQENAVHSNPWHESKNQRYFRLHGQKRCNWKILCQQ